MDEFNIVVVVVAACDTSHRLFDELHLIEIDVKAPLAFHHLSR